MFRNRAEAGKLLGNALAPFRGGGTIVLAIPGGGVPVGMEIAKILGTDLDVIVTRKIGAPGNPEFAIGSVTQDGQTIADMNLLEELQVSREYLEKEAKLEVENIRRRLELYRGKRPYPALDGKTAIICDDGIATGSTMRAAVQSVRKMNASRIIVAVPVGPFGTIAELSRSVDKVICLMTPVNFYAVGDYYGEFEHVGDNKVRDILAGMGSNIETE